MSLKFVLAGAVALALAGAAHAGDLIQNGDFASNGGTGQISYNTYVTDWNVPAPNGSYAFVFAPGTADTTGAVDQWGGNPLTFYGPGNGVSNGLTATSPAGGYYVATDAGFDHGAISQTVNGLTAGDKYTVGFWYAYAQQTGASAATTQQWIVSLGSQTQSTSLYTLQPKGFSGWAYQTFTFTADGASDVLSFLSWGGGSPPFALLSDVTMTSATSVPEPAVWTMLILGVFGVGAAARRRRALALAA